MRPEIGSDFHFGLDSRAIDASVFAGCSRFAPPPGCHAVFTDSGRSAIRITIRGLHLTQGDSVLVPSYICQSVLTALLVEGIRPVLYPVDQSLRCTVDDVLRRRQRNTRGVLIVDYFGFQSTLADSVPLLADCGLKVIYDISHSLLLRLKHLPESASAYTASLRKLLPLPDGGVALFPERTGFLQTNDLGGTCAHALTRAAAMIWKEAWLQRPTGPRPSFRSLFLEAEKQLDQSQCVGALSEISRTLLPLFDLDYLVAQRRKNYLRLLALSRNWPCTVRPLFPSLGAEECPLGFVIVVNNRDGLREYLIRNNVFPPVHWHLQDQAFREFPESLELSKHILTLPCDHRYDSEDMDFIGNLIAEWGSAYGAY